MSLSRNVFGQCFVKVASPLTQGWLNRRQLNRRQLNRRQYTYCSARRRFGAGRDARQGMRDRDGSVKYFGFTRQEDVKKLICLSFRDFIFDRKRLSTPQRSLIGHPGAIFVRPCSRHNSKSIFSHLPDGTGTFRKSSPKVPVPSDALPLGAKIPANLAARPISSELPGTAHRTPALRLRLLDLGAGPIPEAAFPKRQTCARLMRIGPQPELGC